MEANCLINNCREREKADAAARVGVRKILEHWPMPSTAGKLINMMEDAFKAGWVSGVKQACELEF